MTLPDPRLKRIAWLSARRVPLVDISLDVGLAESTLRLIMGSDMFRVLEKEEGLRLLGAPDA